MRRSGWESSRLIPSSKWATFQFLIPSRVNQHCVMR